VPEIVGGALTDAAGAPEIVSGVLLDCDGVGDGVFVDTDAALAVVAGEPELLLPPEQPSN
jgi:hypothetical protein